MIRKLWAPLLVLCVLLGACSSGTGEEPKPAAGARPTAKPTPAQSPSPAGGIVPMGRPVKTDTGNIITVHSWKSGAQRSIAPGPHQVYETADVQFCAGPTTQQSAQDLATLFSLELPNANQVAPDSQAAAGEFRTKGTVHPNACIRGPLVFQVGGGTKPHFVVFAGNKTSKWVVP